jgi:hypothetical protein
LEASDIRILPLLLSQSDGCQRFFPNQIAIHDDDYLADPRGLDACQIYKSNLRHKHANVNRIDGLHPLQVLLLLKFDRQRWRPLPEQ